MVSNSKKVFPITILPSKYHSLFPFEYFNEIQSKIFNLLYNSTKSIIIATPTGSGKTIMAELGIIEVIEKFKDTRTEKIVYLSPLKALTYEKSQEFNKFTQFGLKVESFTGDSFTEYEQGNYFRKLNATNLILSTVEKFDSLTRKESFHSLLKNLKLLIVDEIHLLSDLERGPTLEVVLTRLKLINPTCRIIGLSATLTNVEIVAEWLNAETVFFGDEYRPSKLKKKVITYESTNNDFKDKYLRIYKSWTLVKKFLPHQSLIFVNSRADTVLTAKKLAGYLIKENLAQTVDLELNVQNQRLKEYIHSGVGFHHAGLSYDDKQIVEWLFKEKKIPILVATSTLAWGVNLPAKVVIIQDYEVRNENFENEIISSADLNQMMGRAGRPGFDTTGYGYIIVEQEEMELKIEAILNSQEGMFSSLLEKLEESILGELFRKKYTLEELDEFFKNSFYWAQNTSPVDRANFLEAVERSLNQLEFSKIAIKIDDYYRITPIGYIMGRYYIDIESGVSIARYCSHKVHTGFLLVYNLIYRISLFQNFPVRSTEKKIIKTKEISALIPKEENLSLIKVFSLLYYKIQDKKLPVELTADAFVIEHTFKRYWEFFKAIFQFMNGEQYFSTKRTLFEELHSF